MARHVHVVHGFADGTSGGNPAGIVLDADDLTPFDKQEIAARVGLSETAFVSASDIAEYKVDFFTPNRQIAHCGHATIALFSFLVQSGRLGGQRSSKETVDGVRQIILRGELAFMEHQPPRYLQPENWTGGVSPEAVLASIGLGNDSQLPGFGPVIVNTGVNYMIVPLKDEKRVLSARSNPDQVTQISNSLDLIGYYVFSTQVRRRGHDAGSRMFAPRYAIPEESATGMAAGPLACFLHDILGIKKDNYVIEQGYLMTPASPSELIVELSRRSDTIECLMVGGRGYHVREFQV